MILSNLLFELVRRDARNAARCAVACFGRESRAAFVFTKISVSGRRLFASLPRGVPRSAVAIGPQSHLRARYVRFQGIVASKVPLERRANEHEK